MPIQMQRILPVIVSILIIIVVAILRQYSRTFAAIVATMPINVPLALWIVYSGDAVDREAIVEFTQNLLIGMPPTFVFVLVAWLAARAGWSLVPMIAAGYAAWGITLLLSFAARSLLVR
jgi:hypothetical protein